MSQGLVVREELLLCAPEPSWRNGLRAPILGVECTLGVEVALFLPGQFPCGPKRLWQGSLPGP